MTESSPRRPAPLQRELELALDLAARGGAIALDYQRRGPDALGLVQKPEGGGPVTRADIEVDALIVDTLRRAFPDDAILAEETYEADPSTGADRTRRPRCWMIDPVDGTRDFSEGAPSWAVHIGLCIEGVPTVGVVHEPAAGRTSFAVSLPPEQGGGAWMRSPNGETVEIRVAPDRLEALRIVTSKSHRTPLADPIVEALGVADGGDLRLGSTGVKIVRVARGYADVYAHPGKGTKLWDSCAPEAILSAAGGTLSDLHGDPLRYLDDEIRLRRGLFAAPAPTHAQLAARIRSIAEANF